jgi:hypothetical protein
MGRGQVDGETAECSDYDNALSQLRNPEVRYVNLLQRDAIAGLDQGVK